MIAHDLTGWFQEPGLYVGMAIKFFAYSLFLKYWFKLKISISITASALRTAAGSACGLLIFAALPTQKSTLLFYSCIGVMRLFEWALVFKVLNRDRGESLLIFVFSATIFSSILDLFALFGWYSTAGGIC